MEVLPIKRIVVGFLILEILLIIAGNIFCLTSRSETEDGAYRVEVKRLTDELNTSPDVASAIVDGDGYTVDTEKYPHIISVRLFRPQELTSDSYVVEEVNGKLFRIDYRRDEGDHSLLFMNIGFGALLLITIMLLIFIYRKVIRPFAAMEKLAVDLAKGNLSVPLKEEKSRLFGRFLWGLDMLREQLEESKEREKAYQKERKTLMLSLSHDIKTPLSAIELYEKALSSGLYDTPEKQAEAFAGIHKNAEELRRYIDEITAASREDFLALTVKDSEYYLDDVIAEIRNYYKEKFASLHTEFQIETHGNPLLRGDPDRLEEALQNFLENAIKYGDGRSVTLSFSEEEDAQLIHVTNSGEAPQEDEMVHLFDSFYRGSNVGEKEGSGLGLYISRELMKRMGGDVYAAGSDGGFTVVAVARKA